MQNELVDWELQILREIAGELPASPWGAAVGAAREELQKRGYVRKGALTEKGREYLMRHAESLGRAN